MTLGKRSKIAAAQTAFLLEALSIHQPPNIVPPKGTCVGTAAILDFFNLMLNESHERTKTGLCL